MMASFILVRTACYLKPTAEPGWLPLYRLYYPGASEDHFYTTCPKERTRALKAFGYVDEGVAGFVSSQCGGGLEPLFRLCNDSAHDHFYTLSEQERDRFITEHGYRDEGMVGYAAAVQGPGLVALYRGYAHAERNHFYTTDLEELSARRTLKHDKLPQEDLLRKPQDPLPSTFCVLPFLGMNVLGAGSVRPSCFIFPTLYQDGRVMSVYEYTVQEVWNSDAMRSVRRDLIEGRQNTGCTYCYAEEASGLVSLRNSINETWLNGYMNPDRETHSDLIDRARENDCRLPNGPQWIDLDIGNLCNLKCRMCRPGSSSSIASDPVHTRWTPHAEIPARWQGAAMTIAPARVLGVNYAGLSDVDRSEVSLPSWIKHVATVRLRAGSDYLTSFEISLLAPVACPIEVFLNEQPVASETIEGEWKRSFDIPAGLSKDSALEFCIAAPGVVGLTGLTLHRLERGWRDIGLSRFPSGKPWHQDEKFLYEDLFYDIGSLKKLRVIGGEPMLSKEIIATLRRLVERGHSKTIGLTTVTNGTVFNEEFCEILRHFKEAKLGISVDGVGAIDDYIRSNSSWPEVDANITRIMKCDPVFVYATMTFQAYNMLNVVPLAEYCLSKGLHFRYTYLIKPRHLACGVMPLAARQEAVARIDAFLQQASPSDTKAMDGLGIGRGLGSLRALLLAEAADHDPRLLEDFMTFTNDLDASRNELFERVNPDLVHLIEAAGVPWSSRTEYAHFGRASSR